MTDFRDVFAEVAVHHLDARDTSRIFPGYRVSRVNFRGFLAYGARDLPIC